ncbi:MAG: DUF5723 family protein [Bacteroidaceae bacterium]|nr:DUF5723 family protein [Bacteroidaceae bacterium]
MKKISAIAAAVLVTSLSLAQTTASSYFLEGFNQRNQLNPAFAPERDIVVSVPLLGNLQLGANGSAGLGNFIYQSQADPDRLTTFMSSEVDRDGFVNGLPDVFRIGAGLNMDILSVGVGGENGFTSAGLRLRNDNNVGIPREMFGFMKAGLSNGTYLIEDINVNSTTYLELSVNHSRRIIAPLRVGATVKLLAGIDYTDVNIDRIDADFSEDAWKVRTNASFTQSLPGGKIEYDGEDNSIEGIDYSFSAPESFGLALDLGAEYDMAQFVEGLKVSASITDIGFIRWKDLDRFVTRNDEYVTFSGFQDYDVMGDGDDSDTDLLEDDFSDMLKLYEDGKSAMAVATAATLRAGAEYVLPWVDWIKCGELLTCRTGKWGFFESRTSLVLSPCGWFDFSGNVAFSTRGTSGGLIASFHPSAVTLFIACDCMKTSLNRQYIPLERFGAEVNAGISLALGGKSER